MPMAETLLVADNSVGGLPAACNNWRIGVADSMPTRDKNDPTIDDEKREAEASIKVKLSVSLLHLRESIS